MITVNALGFTMDDVLDAVVQGRVKERNHPDDPRIAIYNYTEGTAFKRDWDPVTLACRGLILHKVTGEILARPFPKFFNHGEPGAAEIGLDEAVVATDKLDGSLGILYPAPGGGYSIATRGSFTSEQAQFASNLLAAKYPDYVPTSPYVTPLFEIIYPENRIVVDYGEARDLVLLGAVHKIDGQIFGAAEAEPYDEFEEQIVFWNRRVAPNRRSIGWPGPRAAEIDAEPDVCRYGEARSTLREVLLRRPRPNAEGFVIRARDGRMVKVKQEDYVRLHRIVTGLNERAVWEHMGDHYYTAAELVREVPEEFHDFVIRTANDLTRRSEAIKTAAERDFDEARTYAFALCGDVKSRTFRSHFADVAKTSRYTPLLFALLDERDIRPMIWKTLRPAGELPEATRT